MRTLHHTQFHSQRAFGLIELMVALLLGIIIMLGVTEVATNNSQTRGELELTGAQIENATYALQLLQDELVSAGFWGEMGEQVSATFPPVCPVTAAELKNALGYPVQGSGVLCSAVVPKTDTNYIAMRRANSCARGSTGCEVAASNFYLQVNSCFKPSDDTAPKPGIDFLINTQPATNLTYKMRDCSTTAPQYRFLSRVYFVNSADRLARAELVGGAYGSATELVDGMELMRLEYGLDTDGDGQADRYVSDTTSPTGPSGTAWANVVTVRISLVMRNSKPSGGFSDDKTYTVAGKTYCALPASGPACDITIPAAFKNYRRQQYSRTVSLRNVAGRWEKA
jgi:type IV pilus assembly protein PilW